MAPLVSVDVCELRSVLIAVSSSLPTTSIFRANTFVSCWIKRCNMSGRCRQSMSSCYDAPSPPVIYVNFIYFKLYYDGYLYVSKVRSIHYSVSYCIFGPGMRVPKSHCSCSSSCCCYQFSKGPKILKAFLICSRAQRNFAYTFMLTLFTDLSLRFFTYFLINK